MSAARASYTWLDENPSEGYNYYRIVSTDRNEKKEYSLVAKVFMGKNNQGASVYSNLLLTEQYTCFLQTRLKVNMG
ncbi:MAG: hypothetical protein ABI416_05440 [Ginsengibacter sp.]